MAPADIQRLGEQAFVLRGLARSRASALAGLVVALIERAPLRRMITPGGRQMSVAMSNCGPLGWVSDASGYRYSPVDPLSGLAWPAMPAAFLALARDAATAAGFADYAPDACLINRYEAGTRLSLHQDRDEQRFDAPIVSVSLGRSADFLFGGLKRGDATVRVPLEDGDVVVWGGVDRLRYHGVLPLKPLPATASLFDGDGNGEGGEGEWGGERRFGGARFNLTFRVAGGLDGRVRHSAVFGERFPAPRR